MIFDRERSKYVLRNEGFHGQKARVPHSAQIENNNDNQLGEAVTLLIVKEPSPSVLYILLPLGLSSLLCLSCVDCLIACSPLSLDLRRGSVTIIETNFMQRCQIF